MYPFIRNSANQNVSNHHIEMMLTMLLFTAAYSPAGKTDRKCFKKLSSKLQLTGTCEKSLTNINK